MRSTNPVECQRFTTQTASVCVSGRLLGEARYVHGSGAAMTLAVPETSQSIRESEGETIEPRRARDRRARCRLRRPRLRNLPGPKARVKEPRIVIADPCGRVMESRYRKLVQGFPRRWRTWVHVMRDVANHEIRNPGNHAKGRV